MFCYWNRPDLVLEGVLKLGDAALALSSRLLQPSGTLPHQCFQLIHLLATSLLQSRTDASSQSRRIIDKILGGFIYSTNLYQTMTNKILQ